MKNSKKAEAVLKIYIKEALMQEVNSMIDTMYTTVGKDYENDVSAREDAIENAPTTMLAYSSEELADHLEDDDDIYGPVPPGENPYYITQDPYSSDFIGGTRNVGRY